MSYGGLKIDVKDKQLADDIKWLRNDLMIYITNRSARSVNDSLPELKATLQSILVRMYNSKEESPTPSNSSNSNDLGISNLRKDLIKEIFGQDLALASKAPDNKNPNSNVFVNRDKRIKSWQPISDSSTYEGEETRFKNRLMNSLIVDFATGRVHAPDPETIKGIKVECSTDTGQTLDSSKKFDAYKNSQQITRTQSTYQRVAIWTVRQADVKLIMDNAISVDDIINEVLQGHYGSAKDLLREKNKNGTYNTAIENIDNIQKGKFVNTNLETFQKLKTLINNLRIKRTDSKRKTTISLVTSYNNETEEQAIDFFTEMRKYIYIWMVNNQEKWINAILNAIQDVAKKYNKK